MATLANQGMASQMSFGQLGSAFKNTASGNLTPPSGMVITAITCLGETKFDVLTPEDEASCFGITTTTHGAGSGGVTVDNADLFPKGITIYGRWTAVSLQADQLTDGIICYFGPSR